MKNSKFNSLNWTLLKIAIIPMIILTLVISIAGSYFMGRSVNDQVEDFMIGIGDTVLASFDNAYPGEYFHTEEDDGIYFFKGEHQFNGDYSYIDTVKSSSNCEITLCYMNAAVITTLTDSNGERRIGAEENQRVFDQVLNNKTSAFYDNVLNGNEQYFAYYIPVLDGKGDAIGMLSIAMKASDIKGLVIGSIYPVLLINLLVFIVICVLVLKFSNGFIKNIRSIEVYMKNIANGDFRTELNPVVLKRNDELGQMARSAVSMSSALRIKVEEDQLTGLYNRRSADKKIKRTIRNYIDKGVNFSLALGDIDFFKKVNDTYGHDAGDAVLQAVSYTFKEYMMGKGYAIRWGGEEFILVFENKLIDEASKALNKVLDEIKALDIVSGNQHIKVTMTFGIVECNSADFSEVNNKKDDMLDRALKMKMDEYISEADKKLYFGKENGRNQLVIDIPSKEVSI